jgi:ParB-like chromosome segregation protein Spo0J
LPANEKGRTNQQVLELTNVPVLLRPDEAAAAMSLIENIQREDLNADG